MINTKLQTKKKKKSEIPWINAEFPSHYKTCANLTSLTESLTLHGIVFVSLVSGEYWIEIVLWYIFLDNRFWVSKKRKEEEKKYSQKYQLKRETLSPPLSRDELTGVNKLSFNKPSVEETKKQGSRCGRLLFRVLSAGGIVLRGHRFASYVSRFVTSYVDNKIFHRSRRG